VLGLTHVLSPPRAFGSTISKEQNNVPEDIFIVSRGAYMQDR
jgi:hypothetical protein